MKLRTKHISKINFNLIIKILIIIILIFIISRAINIPYKTEYRYINMGIPTAFNGFKIVHVSDLSNSSKSVVSKVDRINPDIIIISGKIKDNNDNYNNSLKTIRELSSIAPVYVSVKDVDSINDIEASNIIILDNKGTDISPIEVDPTTFINNLYGNDIISEYNKGDEDTIKFINNLLNEYNKTLDSTIKIYGLRDDDDQMLDNNTFNIVIINNDKDIDNKSKKYINMLLVGGLSKESDYKSGWTNNNGTDIFISSGIAGDKSILPQVQVIDIYSIDAEPKTPLEKILKKIIKRVDAKHMSDVLNTGNIDLNKENK